MSKQIKAPNQPPLKANGAAHPIANGSKTTPIVRTAPTPVKASTGSKPASSQNGTTTTTTPIAEQIDEIASSISRNVPSRKPSPAADVGSSQLNLVHLGSGSKYKSTSDEERRILERESLNASKLNSGHWMYSVIQPQCCFLRVSTTNGYFNMDVMYNPFLREIEEYAELLKIVEARHTNLTKDMSTNATSEDIEALIRSRETPEEQAQSEKIRNKPRSDFIRPFLMIFPGIMFNKGFTGRTGNYIAKKIQLKDAKCSIGVRSHSVPDSRKDLSTTFKDMHAQHEMLFAKIDEICNKISVEMFEKGKLDAPAPNEEVPKTAHALTIRYRLMYERAKTQLQSESGNKNPNPIMINKRAFKIWNEDFKFPHKIDPSQSDVTPSYALYLSHRLYTRTPYAKTLEKIAPNGGKGKSGGGAQGKGHTTQDMLKSGTAADDDDEDGKGGSGSNTTSSTGAPDADGSNSRLATDTLDPKLWKYHKIEYTSKSQKPYAFPDGGGPPRGSIIAPVVKFRVYANSSMHGIAVDLADGYPVTVVAAAYKESSGSVKKEPLPHFIEGDDEDVLMDIASRERTAADGEETEYVDQAAYDADPRDSVEADEDHDEDETEGVKFVKVRASARAVASRQDETETQDDDAGDATAANGDEDGEDGAGEQDDTHSQNQDNDADAMQDDAEAAPEPDEQEPEPEPEPAPAPVKHKIHRSPVPAAATNENGKRAAPAPTAKQISAHLTAPKKFKVPPIED